jgi:hypothetical protein
MSPEINAYSASARAVPKHGHMAGLVFPEDSLPIGLNGFSQVGRITEIILKMRKNR